MNKYRTCSFLCKWSWKSSEVGLFENGFISSLFRMEERLYLYPGDESQSRAYLLRRWTGTLCTHERTCVGAAEALTNWASQTNKWVAAYTNGRLSGLVHYTAEQKSSAYRHICISIHLVWFDSLYRVVSTITAIGLKMVGHWLNLTNGPRFTAPAGLTCMVVTH